KSHHFRRRSQGCNSDPIDQQTATHTLAGSNHGSCVISEEDVLWIYAFVSFGLQRHKQSERQETDRRDSFCPDSGIGIVADELRQTEQYPRSSKQKQAPALAS